MTALIRQLTATGLQPVAYAADSLKAAVKYEPEDGVYTVTNTYNSFQVLKLDAHLDRLEESARREGIPLQLDRLHLRRALREMIEEFGWGDVRFRITVPRESPDMLILSIEPFRPPLSEIVQNGVACITTADGVRHHPEAKTTDWMHDREALASAMPDDIYDTFLVDREGRILEGLGANFYAVLNDELRTAGEGVLKGIAQQIVFEVAPPILPVNIKAVMLHDLPHLAEAFLTSSSRGIIPVTKINGDQIGAGIPGRYTKALQIAYTAWVKTHLEEL